MKKHLIVFLAACMTTSLAFAQEGPRGSEWYRQNDRGNRFEGYYSDQVGVGAIELVSFTGYAPSYQFGQDQNLYVHFYLPNRGIYQLNAKEIQVDEYYWCESKKTNAGAGWNTFGPWPVDDKLVDGPVSERDLGIVLKVGDQNKIRLAPVFVSQTNTPTRSGYYVAKFGVGRNITGGEFRVYEGEQAVGSKLIFTKTIRGGSGGTSKDMVISEGVLPREGWYLFEVELDQENSDVKMAESFLFYHYTP